MTAPFLPTMLDYSLIVLSGRELGWQQPSIETVVEITQRFHRDSALTVLIRLNLALTHHRPASQQDIIRSWLPSDVAGAFIEAMRTERATHLFHELQVLNLIRLVILHGRPDDGLRCDRPEHFVLMVRALVMMTDLIFGRGQPTQARSWVFAAFTRSETFLHDEAYFPHVIARNYDLFLRLPRIMRRAGSWWDIPANFMRISGLDVEDYLGLGFGLLTKYDTTPATDVPTGPIGVKRDGYFADVLLPPEQTDRIWEVVARPIEHYRAALETEWGRTDGPARWAAMRPFSEFPMIEFPDGTVVAISRRLLRDRITHGIYWIIANNLPSQERQRFTDFFGDVFEEYVRRCFLRALGHAFHPRPTYGRERIPLVDGALVTRRSLGLPECKAGRLLLGARELGSREELVRSVEPGLDRAARQLEAAVRAGQRGEIVGIATDDDTRYYPMIITYESLPAHPLALEVYQEIVHRGGRLEGRHVKPVTILDVRDVESVEGLIKSGVQWPDLLTRKHTDRYLHLPFHNYLYACFGGEFPRTEYLKARWDQIGDGIGQRLFGQCLRG